PYRESRGRGLQHPRSGRRQQDPIHSGGHRHEDLDRHQILRDHMSAFSAFDWLTFLTILFLTFSLFLVITGAFTAYFGSGKSRKIGVRLLVGGLIVGTLWAWYAGPFRSSVSLVNVIVESIGVILAAIIGAAAAIR